MPGEMGEKQPGMDQPRQEIQARPEPRAEILADLASIVRELLEPGALEKLAEEPLDSLDAFIISRALNEQIDPDRQEAEQLRVSADSPSPREQEEFLRQEGFGPFVDYLGKYPDSDKDRARWELDQVHSLLKERDSTET